MGRPAQHRPVVVSIGDITPADHFVLLGSQDGFVRAVDADTGALIWTSSSAGMVQASPAGWFEAFGAPVDRNLVLFGSRNTGADNQFHAVKMKDGDEEWAFENKDAMGIGIVSGGASVDYARARVYFGSHERAAGASTVFALTLDKGVNVWKRPLGNVSTSPIQRGEALYVGADDGNIYSLDVDDGSDRTTTFATGDGPPKGFIFPDFFGNRLYLSTTNTVLCLEDTGTALERCWSHTGIESPSVPLYPPGSRFLWLGSGDGRIYQIDVTTGSPLEPPQTTSLVLGDGTAGIGAPSYDVLHRLLYVGSEDGVVYAVQAPF